MKGRSLFLVMLGAPGSGKGTQSYRLSQKFGIRHVSSGDLIRNNPNLPEEARQIVESGGYIPDEMITEIVKNKLNEPPYRDGWILDGFPRTLKQAEYLEVIAPKPPLVIYLLVDEEEIKNRLSLRRTCQNCGAIFHLKNHPPKKENQCDLCNGPLICRDDDRPEVIERRFKIYNERTYPLIQFYSKKGHLITIDSTGEKTPDQVFSLILEELPLISL